MTLAVALGLFAHPAVADDGDRPHLWREVWAGADVSADAWLVYSGATVAPFSHIHEDGLRLRVTGGTGGYRYRNVVNADGDHCDFEAETSSGDILAGYLMRLDPITLKVFAGAAYIDHAIAPIDHFSISNGADWGVKGVVEIWVNIGDNAWGSLDLAYTSAHSTASVRMRTGYRLQPQISLGIEGALNVDGQAQCKMKLGTVERCAGVDVAIAHDEPHKTLLDYGRAGLFARYEWTGGELSLSGGAIGQMFSNEGDVSFNPYATANLILQF